TFFFRAEDGIRDFHVTGVQTCALPISAGEQRLLAAFDRVDRGLRHEVTLAGAGGAVEVDGAVGLDELEREALLGEHGRLELRLLARKRGASGRHGRSRRRAHAERTTKR